MAGIACHTGAMMLLGGAAECSRHVAGNQGLLVARPVRLALVAVK